VPEVSKIYNEMINDAINHLDSIPLDPWDIYGTILKGFRKALDNRRDHCEVSLEGLLEDSRRIVYIRCYGENGGEDVYQANMSEYKLYFDDFLYRIFPLVSSGIIGVGRPWRFQIHIVLKKGYTDKWIDRVMSNRGKA